MRFVIRGGAKQYHHQHFFKNPVSQSCRPELIIGMSKEKRSKGACWTCSFRRKKCDEALPICSVCASLSIPCFGYEPSPSWADGGEKQRAKTEELRIIIRENAALKRRQARQKQQTTASFPKTNRKKDLKKGTYGLKFRLEIC